MYRMKVRLAGRARNRVALDTDPGDEPLWRELFLRHAERDLVAAIGPPTRRRSLDQNALHWALLHILSQEQDGSDELVDLLHEAQLDDFGSPKRHRDGTVKQDREGRTIWKRSHEMTVAEFARLIEGDFRRLAEHGVRGLDHAQAIRNYWIEWRQWRRSAGNDALDDGEYRQRIPYCEACVLRQGEHLAHIVSRGAAPAAKHEPWNWLHLCARCHLYIEHEAGQMALVRSAPHLLPRINAARKQCKLAPLEVKNGSDRQD